ncbi:MFS transporter [Nonomuraea sp. NPDC049709]|uniref:MFS transporter n=1 Tax=Nonomuraea sp. NPDC049709 TaxID=3154736 RepID=UPI0034390256
MRIAGRAERLPRTVWWLVLARGVNRLGAFSLGFLTVLISTEFGAGAVTAGLVSAAFGLATIPSRLLGGFLADRLGRRRTIVAGLAGCALAQAGIAASGSVAMLAVFAVLLGLVFEIYEPPSQAMIADAVRPAQQAQAFSLFNTALAVGGMGAGLIAAGLGRWDLRWLFVVDAVTCVACAIVVRLVLPADHPTRHQPASLPSPTPRTTPPPHPDDPPGPKAPPRTDAAPHNEGPPHAGGPPHPQGQPHVDDPPHTGSAPHTEGPFQVEGPAVAGGSAWRDRSLLVLLVSGTLLALIYMQVMMALPLALVRRGLPAADAGLLSTVSAVVMVLCQPLLRWTAPLSHHAAMVAGYLLLATGLAGYAVAGGLPGHLAATVVWSAGDLLMFGRSYAMVVSIAPEDSRGRYLSIFGTSWGFATVLAPLSSTQLLEHAGPAGLWGGLALMCLLLAAAQLTVVRPLLRRQAARSGAPGLVTR